MYVRAVGDVGYLCRGERDDLTLRAISVDEVEVVEVPPRGSHDQDASSLHPSSLSDKMYSMRHGAHIVFTARFPQSHIVRLK